MFRRTLALPVMAVIFALLLFGCTKKEQAGGAVATDFSLQDLNGKTVKLSDFKGKTVLLDFWATWCPPCRASIPGIEKLHKAYREKGLVVLGISLDEGGWDAVNAFRTEYGMTYSVLKGNEDVSVQYMVRSIPTLIVVDKQGIVARRYLGFGNEDELEKDIKNIL